MSTRPAHGWELVLADLALILFLVTLSALGQEQAEWNANTNDRPTVTSSLALFRPDTENPSLSEWLAEQPRDSRATLTIFAQHTGEDHSAIWERAQALAEQAKAEEFAVRVVITQGNESDIYASLAYDVATAAR